METGPSASAASTVQARDGDRNALTSPFALQATRSARSVTCMQAGRSSCSASIDKMGCTRICVLYD